MPENLEVTIAVMKNDVDRIKLDIKDIKSLLEQLVKESGHHADHENRIKTLEEWQTWVIRIVIGAVLTGILAGGYLATK